MAAAGPAGAGPALGELLPGFRDVRVAVGGGVEIAASVADRAGRVRPPLLLLHGHPQTRAMWHRVAPALAETRTVVAADLRGYGDSSRPPADAGYDKRTMANDLVALLRSLGHDHFEILAHDRGARVAHRLALDHAGSVGRLALLDIAPTLAMYEQANEAFARAYWHWFFLIQPAPLPERLIQADPRAYVRDVIGRRHAGLDAFHPLALAEYERCIARPGSAAAICADYRASAGVDLEHDRADRAAGRRLGPPLLVLWGEHGVVGRCFDVLAEWRRVADDVSGEALPCGHYVAEEAPEPLLERLRAWM